MHACTAQKPYLNPPIVFSTGPWVSEAVILPNLGITQSCR